jgi:hypothetical protein
MQVQIRNGNQLLNPNHIEPDNFIFMSNLDSTELKVNHLGLYLKTAICENNLNVDVELVEKAIEGIDLSIFVNGICEGNNSVKTLLAKNVTYQLARCNVQVPFSQIYGFLDISKSITNSTIQ